MGMKLARFASGDHAGRAKLTKRLGSLPDELLREIEEGLKAAMDLD
jgi:mRNA-degrading endonuclease toxin of MazEF toxin-antitoxin module